MHSLIRSLLIAALSLSAILPLQGQDKPSGQQTYVIVHGATAGGWEWKRTAKHLSADGHDVYRVTLTGLGERHHLAHADVDLDTHINDVVNLILFEDLHDVVLTGHSYGGMVITGVIDQIPERIKHVIYLDAAIPEDGESLYDLFGGNPGNSAVKDGLVYFPWFDAEAPFPKGMPHPQKTFSQSVSYDNPAALELPVTYVAFVPEDQLADDRAKSDKGWQRAEARGWKIRTFPGGHVAHEEDPRGVATLIEDSVKH